VILVGICAPSRDSGFRIFESMNDRGTRLTPIDLLKSYLLSHVREGEEELNLRWRRMLSELTISRDDDGAPTRFLKAALIAQHARVSESTQDVSAVNHELHQWVRQHAAQVLHLTEANEYFTFVDQMISLAALYRTFLHASRAPDDLHNLKALHYNERNGLTNQMVFILAAIRSTDTLQKPRRKTRWSPISSTGGTHCGSSTTNRRNRLTWTSSFRSLCRRSGNARLLRLSETSSPAR
jgi:hypothetical protein